MWLAFRALQPWTCIASATLANTTGGGIYQTASELDKCAYSKPELLANHHERTGSVGTDSSSHRRLGVPGSEYLFIPCKEEPALGWDRNLEIPILILLLVNV
ncbi:hypothetical protein B0H66DRAFT_528845 [Apodospora peruviana]|uniref:Secreted protein n=1 Tax=Apodospora peruviana TaxID=516989 RepID=A0AAE0IV50_9PEZI|nr:hypothetical protein B0H66DRAFT_528845 [Apodospora peruviana]